MGFFGNPSTIVLMSLIQYLYFISLSYDFVGFYLLIDVYLLFILGKLIFEQIYCNYGNLCKESSRDENRRFSQRLIKETQSKTIQGNKET